MNIEIKHLYISKDHNFKGHHGKPAGTNPEEERDAIECVAGKGVVGDRYFEFKENFKGQITFFALEVFDRLIAEVGAEGKLPSTVRRNVFTVGVDLNELIGREFEIQGIRFSGTQECAPCYWMDDAVGSGAEAFLKDQGGLRARILTSGTLKKGPAELSLLKEP